MKKYLRFTGCFMSFFQLTGIVFYIILMINKFNAGVDWLTGFFLIYGLVGIVCIPMPIINLFFAKACKIERYENAMMRCECHREE